MFAVVAGFTMITEPISQDEDEDWEDLHSHRNREVEGYAGVETINDTIFPGVKQHTQ